MRRIRAFLYAAYILAPGTTLFAHPAAVPAAPNVSSSPAASAAVTILEKVCLPLLRGSKVSKVASSAGLHDENGQWILPINGKQRALLQTPDAANPHVCQARITYRVGAQPSIRNALDGWAKSQKPPFTPGDVLKPSIGPRFKRLASSWAGRTAAGSVDIVLSDLKTLQGKPADGDLDRSVLIVGLTPRSPSTSD